MAMSFFAIDNSTESFSLGGALEVRVDPVITTTTVDFKGMKVESPFYQAVYGM